MFGAASSPEQLIGLLALFFWFGTLIVCCVRGEGLWAIIGVLFTNFPGAIVYWLYRSFNPKTPARTYHTHSDWTEREDNTEVEDTSQQPSTSTMSEGENDEEGERNTVNFSVRIIDEEGSPKNGVVVYVTYSYITESETTDDDGWAYFSKVCFSKSMSGGVGAKEIGVGDTVLKENAFLEDGDSFSFTVADD